ncbi:MAG: alanine--glyoxylate aminotransferase family protein [Alphaproteobacteria bacterium]|nr:alanine--glyoxylate aminotransferase family protein [Alphaproteobacteria bacterium]MCB9697673.1 alanine--glyoxylate aminotransferase family protein [Alphaproteobacteria bacterium]
MIPGPVALSPAVLAAAAEPPVSHVSPVGIASFGDALRAMRRVWAVGDDHQPFLLAGSGTLAMESAASNTTEPGQRALVLVSGVFGDRMARILERRGVTVEKVTAPVGEPVSTAAAAEAMDRLRPHVVFVTHVDTSTGVRTDPGPIGAMARARGALLVVDGVCSVGGEAPPVADVVLTASQKALGAPPGLALLVASPAALQARLAQTSPPPLYVDWEEWLPIHRAYEEGRPSYFATPATSLVRAMATALGEIEDPAATVARHAAVAEGMRRAWSALGLRLVPTEVAHTASTLSALWLPEGTDASFVGRIGAQGVAVAGGLHSEIRARTFRVGHMGWVTTQPALLARTVRAVGVAMRESGLEVDVDAAVAALTEG